MRSGRRSSGFTIVELLAVIAIVAILVALLFPITRSTLNASKNAKCISNLRTIGAGLHAYMADFDGTYPPNRYNIPYTVQTGRRPYPSEVLNGTVPTNLYSYVTFAGRGSAYLKARKDAGPWFCPADTTRPIALSADSYAGNIYLGNDDRVDGQSSAWEPWWSKSIGDPHSGRLVYLIDHTLLRIPPTTAGWFSHKSWPVKPGTKPDADSGDPTVDFDRHDGHANALKVDGSVQALTKADLSGLAGKKLIDPTK